MKRAVLATRWFRVVLRLLPEPVRREHAADMLGTFELRLSQRPRGPRLWFVIRETFGVMRFAMHERQALVSTPLETRRPEVADMLVHNLWTGIRTMQRSPGFTAMAVLILGVGIGLTTAIFSALDAVLLRPSSYVNAHELVNVERTAGSVNDVIPWPHAHYELVRERGGPFTGVAAYGDAQVTLTGLGEPVRVTTEFVTDNYLALLGIAPLFGHGLLPGDAARAAADREVLLSHSSWRERFGGRDVLGESLTVNGGKVVVAGVLPPGFHGESGAAELFAPVSLAPDLLGDASLMQPYVMWLSVIGRLREGVTPEVAAEQMLVMDGALRAEGEYPIMLGDNPIAVRPLHGSRIEPAFRRALVLTFGAAAIVMLIVCLNISSLLLVRTQARERELAIRGAIGASRARLMGQLVTESLLLAGAGGVAGLAIAWGALRVLTALRPAPTPGFWSSYARALDMHAFSLDARVLGFTCALTLLAGVLSGLLPVLRARAEDFASRIRGEGGSTASGPSWARTRSGIVAVEVALAFMLVVAAGLVATSLLRMQREDLGFAARDVVTMRLQLPASTHRLEDATQFYDELLRRIDALPGVQSASLSTGLPVTGSGGTTDFVPDGHTGEDLPTIDVMSVSTRYFETLGVRLRSGRVFTDADRTGAYPVILSAAAANMHWPGENAVGRRARARVATRTRDPVEVVGVVEDVQYRAVGDEVRPIVYVPTSRRPALSAYVNVRTSAPGTAVAAALRTEVSRLDPTLAITEIRSMRERVGAATSRARFSAVLVSAFAAVAAFLALLGVYSLVAYSVRTRTREFGVRLALGSEPRGIIGLMLREISVIAVVGIALGLAGSVAAARAVQSQLYGVVATDPRALASVTLLMLLAAGLAAYVPARRVLGISASAELMRD